MNRKLREKLSDVAEASDEHRDVHDRDALHKLKRNIIADQQRRPKNQVMETWDIVLSKNLHRTNKVEPTFEEQPYKVVEKRGNTRIVHC